MNFSLLEGYAKGCYGRTFPASTPVGVVIAFDANFRQAEISKVVTLSKVAWYSMNTLGICSRSKELRPGDILISDYDGMKCVRDFLADPLLPTTSLPFVLAGHNVGGMMRFLQEQFGEQFRGFILEAGVRQNEGTLLRHMRSGKHFGDVKTMTVCKCGSGLKIKECVAFVSEAVSGAYISHEITTNCQSPHGRDHSGTFLNNDASQLTLDAGIEIVSCEGYKLRSLRCVPATKPTGIVIHFHGGCAHSRVSEVAPLRHHMLDLNLAWYALDHHGHGLSCRRGDPNHSLQAGEIPAVEIVFADYKTWLSKVLDFEQPNLPIILIGHAMGACTLMHLIPWLQKRYTYRLRGFCITGCSFDSKKMPISLIRTLARRFPRSTPGGKEFSMKAFVRDSEALEKILTDPLRVPRATLSLLAYLFETRQMVSTQEHLNLINIPLLFVLASEDHFVAKGPNCDISLYLFKHIGSASKEVLILHGAKHNVYADPLTQIFIDRCGEFVHGICTSGFNQ